MGVAARLAFWCFVAALLVVAPPGAVVQVSANPYLPPAKPASTYPARCLRGTGRAGQGDGGRGWEFSQVQVGPYVVGVFSVLGPDDALLSAEEFEGPVRPGEAHRVGAHKAKRRRLGAYRPAVSTVLK